MKPKESSKRERYLVKQGRWGMYIYDQDIGAAVDLYAIESALNGDVKSAEDSTWRHFVDNILGDLSEMACVPKEPTLGSEALLEMVRGRIKELEMTVSFWEDGRKMRAERQLSEQ